MTEADHWIDADFSDDSATFGDRITAGREALGLTVSQLSRQLGVKAETINKRLSVYSEEDEEKWREFIYLIYQKLLENIQQKLKEQQMAEWDKAFNRQIKYEVKGQKVHKGHLYTPIMMPEVVVGPQYQEYAVKVYQKLVELVRSKLGEDGVGLGQFGSGKIESGVTEIAMNPNFIPNTNHGVGGCKITSL